MLLTVEEAAGELKISSRKLEYMIAAGEIPVVRIGRSVRVNRDKLSEWVRRNTE